ncbi:enolase C-terminal domain-like protein [Pseudooctadecabacter jejudonensis]|uniref:glucarate dehydratase n=1 Tax=Pseudooctadecabacter jejudonensis TaxID=1391910 RepID=A0A1Y5TFJ0_9RHOB|nr:enolase C-terminal domain-like protein [Pseudooctadecabacter jejudonensis]SLN62649.1 Glucarate dehydratase [Pseudooctadecabacter jejudonensis]
MTTIADIKATTVAVPLEAPLRHANGTHWGRFVRTIIEVIDSEGRSGWGEMGGGGESAEAAVLGLKPYLIGHDPIQLEQLRWKLMNPTASLYNNRMQLHAAVEMACMDLAGQQHGLRACDLLGGAIREAVPFASYLFYRYENDAGTAGGETRADDIVAMARTLKDTHGFTTHKLKGGHFAPDHDITVMEALADAFPGDSLRLDPNGVWSVEEAIRVGRAIEHLPNDYFEDPTWGLDGMRRVRDRTNIPTATNQVVVNFEQLVQSIRQDIVDVILLDTTFWGGLRQAYKAGTVLETFQFSAAVHSSGELGIQLASMLHLGAALPNLNFAADAHYHHLTDDIIEGGLMTYENGAIAVPKGPGLGVEVNRDKLAEYAEHFKSVGGYAYDRDPGRPDWYAVMPERNYADPAVKKVSKAP